MNKSLLYRNIPKVDVLLEQPLVKALVAQYSRASVVEAIREQTEELRLFINECEDVSAIQSKIDNLLFDVKNRVFQLYEYNMKPVINGTGTILHTNLGRAPISAEHASRIQEVVTGYSNLEYTLEKGSRGERYSHFEELLCRVTGAEAAIAVNNNAAAVLLMLGTMAKGGEVIVSRGELVEIGGKFRIPDVMKQSGSTLVEIGTTNKTHLSDYEEEISENTTALLKVHTSNYKIVGFTQLVGVEELAGLAGQHDIPLIEDIGSGVFIDLSKYGLTYEPTVQDSLKKGASVVSFSGDKLLGGPQAGIIVGKKKYIDKMKKNPLMRAIRIDKFTAAALELTLQEYLSEENAVKKIPVLQMITASAEAIEQRARNIAAKLQGLDEQAEIGVEACESQIGGGSLPTERLNSYAVVVHPKKISTEQLEEQMRCGEHPVVARVSDDKLYIDARTVFDRQIDILTGKLRQILQEG